MRSVRWSLLFVATCASLATGATSQLVAPASAAWWSEARDGRALVVYEDGKLLFEQYAGGVTRDTGFAIASITKSFASVLAACAVRDGLIRDFDELVADSLTEWKGDNNKSKITYRDLLSMSSGLDGGTSFIVPTYAEAVRAAATVPPGVRFQYGPNPYQAFGAALERKLASRNQTVTDYLQTALLAPIGIRVSAWIDALKGQPQFPSGAALTAPELMKFGEFLRNRGFANGKQLIPSDLLAECLKVSSTNPGYRVGFYGPSPTTPGGIDMFWCAGAGGQRLYVLPEYGLTILRYAVSTRDIDDGEFQKVLFPAWTGNIGVGCRGSRGIPRLTSYANTVPFVGALDYALTILSCPENAIGIYLLGASQH
ncbi:MAG: serine hydrolase, partial [Planctomycetes bacterium]|nr:serine hydrolase [Planctomycetota bacterium]